MSKTMERLEHAICSEHGPRLLRTLSRLSLCEPLDEQDLKILPILAELGLGRQTNSGFALDKFGYKCADAAREYIFWTERGRRLHFEDVSRELSLSNFENKRVLEVGSGWGCSLFSFQQVTPHVRGREIEDIYVRFTPIFAKLEGIEPPPVDIGAGEELPYAEGGARYI
jgi:hypothetical protein